MANESKPEVAVVMGSSSDWETMKRACDILDQFGVVYHKQVISAHRTPELMAEFAHNARANGLNEKGRRRFGSDPVHLPAPRPRVAQGSGLVHRKV